MPMGTCACTYMYVYQYQPEHNQSTPTEPVQMLNIYPCLLQIFREFSTSDTWGNWKDQLTSNLQFTNHLKLTLEHLKPTNI